MRRSSPRRRWEVRTVTAVTSRVGSSLSKADVQALDQGSESGDRYVGAQGMARDRSRLVDAGHHAPVGALHLDAFVHPLIGAAGIVEAEGHGPHPRNRLRVRRIVFGRRLEPPDFIVRTQIRHSAEPSQYCPPVRYRHAAGAPVPDARPANR